jgi:diguanylate cyclase (GGDEF)-like protein
VIGASTWLICALLSSAMLAVWAPDHGGKAGWFCAAAFIASVALISMRVLSARSISLYASLLGDLYVIGGLGLLAWFSGAPSGYNLLIALTLAFVGGSQPPARILACLALAAVTLPIGLAERHFSSGTVVTDLVTLVFWLLLVGMATAWNAGVRWQRLALAHSEDQARRRASHDSVTGLGNRRKLLTDLEEVVRDGRLACVALFDLNGFKTYNDTFGHLAGDALLERLGGKLDAAASMLDHGSAYRLGGDEFVLLSLDGDVDRVVSTGGDALREVGTGFVVTAAGGGVALPAEATNASDALRLADERMYAQKYERRAISPAHGTQMLLALVQERYPELSEHGQAVTELALAVGERLGLSTEESERLRLGAQLHDIGKLAIPEAILAKPAALSDEEWAFIRRHTIVGERILAAAPPLKPVAEIVRATHERIDGRGYPDGLRGGEIPLLARVIAVCDAYDAITSLRPYRAAATLAEAVAELRRSAGSQFDPVVVELFVQALRERDAALAAAAA